AQVLGAVRPRTPRRQLSRLRRGALIELPGERERGHLVPGPPPPPFRCQRGKPPICGIGDQGRSVVELPQDHVQRAACRVWILDGVGVREERQKEIVAGDEVAGRVAEEPLRTSLQLTHFLIGQELSSLQDQWPLERRDTDVRT